jgi:2-polyprenyl-3-methyl-5-hydroxy-6-metoxy-1,4-benzoquinol methylase
MGFDTPDQSKLHRARQKQLDISDNYTKSFLSAINPVDAYVDCPCPTCGTKALNSLFEKRGGKYSYCQNCDHIYLSNQLKQELLFRFYRDYPTSSLEWHHEELSFYRDIYASGIALLFPLMPTGKILDIGSSSGLFLSIAKEHGYCCFGIEPNTLERSYALERGLEIIGSTIDDIKSSQSTFDIITLWDVLEHIYNPVEYLSLLADFLNPGGVILLQVPTSDSLAARIMRQYCNMFDGIEHLTLFSSKSLDIAFKQAGFTRQSSASVITDYFAISNYLSYESDPYHPKVHGISGPSCIDSETIISSSMGYKIQAVYQINR